MPIPRHAYTVAFLIAFAGLSPPLHAGEDAADRPDIIVVGQSNAPMTIEPRGLSVSLGEEQFAGVNAFNVEDLMKYAPDFFVRSRYVGDNNGVPGFRGTHSTQSARALVMVDGFVVSNFLGNSFAFPPAWGVISPGEVKQFDIVYGPYSARYSGNAMGGIVNITTRAPERTEAFVNMQGFVQPYDQYGTHDDYWGWSGEAGFALKQKDGPLSLRVSGRRLINRGHPQQFYQFGYSAANYGNPSAGTPVTGAVVDNGMVPVTGTAIRAPIVGDYSSVDTRQDQLRGQLRFDQGDVHAEAFFTYWWNEEKTLDPQSYLRDANGQPYYGGGLVSFGGHTYSLNAASTFNWGIARKDEWLAGVKLDAPLLGFDTRTTLSTLRFDRQDALQSSGFANGRNNGAGQITSQGPTGWYTGEFQASRIFGAHSIAWGLSGNRYDTDRSVYGTANWRDATGRTFRNRTFGRTRLLGAFIEDEIAIGDAITLTAGLRAESWRAFGGGLTALASAGAQAGQAVTQRYASRKDSAFSPKLALRTMLSPDWSAELSLATATRFPTVGELFQGSLNGDGSFNQNSFDPNLKAEKSRDANLLLRHHMGPVTLTGSLFYQRVRDAIFSYIGFNQNGVSTSSFKNIDLTRQYGAELIMESRNWPVEGLDMEANAAWIDAETVRNRADPLSEGVQFPRIPRWRLNGSIRYAVTPTLQSSLGFRYASRPNTDLDGLQRGDTYGYTSELFALDAKLTQRFGNGMRVSAGVNNITNDKAWVFHPYPQRSFLIEAGWTL
ncbi:TonB-dependent receptor [Sphingobium phenoxybenzoativorans]|uniref:TonB-dependent receptor n=1 Tax=Sphingobium phenoxybenzoativorans TaxID=1592790 RepID=UPI0009F55776|nr:TonB-dependent receptor [Sphingobium phenoxybenzoativorans]